MGRSDQALAGGLAGDAGPRTGLALLGLVAAPMNYVQPKDELVGAGPWTQELPGDAGRSTTPSCCSTRCCGPELGTAVPPPSAGPVGDPEPFARDSGNAGSDRSGSARPNGDLLGRSGPNPSGLRGGLALLAMPWPQAQESPRPRAWTYLFLLRPLLTGLLDAND